MNDLTQWQGWDGNPSLPKSQPMFLNHMCSVNSEATLSHIAVQCNRLDRLLWSYLRSFFSPPALREVSGLFHTFAYKIYSKMGGREVPEVLELEHVGGILGMFGRRVSKRA